MIELMMTVAILAIIMGYAIPSLGDFYDKKRLIAGAEAIYGELQYARSEAVARSQNIIVTFDRDSNTDWDLGMIAGATPCDPDVLVPTAANACYLEVDDGDGVSTPANDYVLKRLEHEDYTGVNFIAQDFTSNDVTFNFVRGTANSGTVTLRSDEAVASNRGGEIRVLVNSIGRISMCSPSNDASGNYKVVGYPDC